MVAVSWKNNNSGNWSVGANWSTGIVPGPTSDVTISTASAQTITHSAGNDTIASLLVGGVDTLSLTGGAITVHGNTILSGALKETAGTLKFAGATAQVGGVVNQTAGTIQATSGVLAFTGTGNSFAGTLTGSTVNFAAGSDTLQATATLSANHVVLSGATVTLGASFTDTGTWTESAGNLALGGKTLTLSGAANFTGGAITGAGTVAATGATHIDSLFLEGSAVISNSATITQTGNWFLGFNGADTAQLVNKAGATFTIANNSNIFGTAGTKFTNAGTLIKKGSGESQIRESTTSSGAITIASGTLAFGGATNAFGGKIGGPGTLELYSGTDTFNAGLALTAGNVLLDGANLSLNTGLVYAGTFTQTTGTLALGGKVLTLSGNSNFDGGVINGAGTVSVTGAGEISSLFLEGSSVLNNTKSIVQNGNWFLGFNGADTSRLVNAAGATFTIVNNSNIFGTAGATFTNAGTLIKQGGGDSQIRETTTNTGTISIAAGTLSFSGTTNSFGGTVSGPGTLELSAGTDTFNAGLAMTAGHLLLDGANLTLNTGLVYGGTFNQTTGTLALGGKTLALSNTSNFGGGVISGAGTVSVTGTAEISSLFLEGSTVLNNTKSITQDGNWFLGFNGTDTSRLVNAAGATFTIANNSSIFGVVGATITNAGTLIKKGGGDSQIRDSITNSGTMTIVSGSLSLSGGKNTLGGRINGAGKLALTAGTDTFNPGLALNAGSVLLSGANLTLGANLAYAGNLTQTAGTLALGGKVLTLSGVANFDGGIIYGAGTVAVTGSGEISSLFLEGSAVISNSATITQTGNWNVGLNATDTSQLVNTAGATFNIANDADIFGTAGAELTNEGTLVKSGAGGVSSDAIATINNGLIRVDSGTMSFLGQVSGTGTIDISAGAILTFGSSVAAGTTVDMGADTALTVQATAGFAGKIADFAAGDLITLAGFGFSGASLSFNAVTDKLTVTNGATNTSLQLVGSYKAADFYLFNNAGLAAIGHA